jgi:hypothetical protein
MTMTKAVAAIGTLLQAGVTPTSPATYNTISELTNIGGPEISRDFFQATHHLSTGMYHEFVPGFKTGGSITLEMNFIGSDSTQVNSSSGLTYDFDNGILRAYQIKFTNNVLAQFNAYVEKFQPKAPVSGILSASASLKTTGPVLWSTWT